MEYHQIKRIKTVLFILSGVCLIFLSSLVQANGLNLPPNAKSRMPLLIEKPKANSKIRSELNGLNQILLDSVAKHQNRAVPVIDNFSNSIIKVKQGLVQVYLYLNAMGDFEKSILKRYGVIFEIINEELGTIQGWIPIQSLEAVASLSCVRQITAPSYATTMAGNVTTEGDVALHANALRLLGLDGSGVKVGVISDGISHLAASQATNDSPIVTTIMSPGSGDEGTAMIEIVHDLAPEASIGFCGPHTSLEFIQCVNDLKNTFKADIIVDDIGFLNEPYFEDGPVAQAVANVVAQDIFYTTSAGNGAQSHYAGSFNGVEAGGYGPLHDFGAANGGASDLTLNVLVAPNQAIKIYFEWNAPFGRASDDYDLFLLDSSGNQVLTSSQNPQNGNGDPIEAVIYTNPSDQEIEVQIAIIKASGADKLLKMFVMGAVRLEEYNIPSGSIYGHAAVKGVLAVAAINAKNPGHIDAETFSSQGPVQIFFPAPETRQKPDITAIDGVAISGAGGFPSPFIGTSAAAPHIAGIAALLKTSFPNTQALANRLNQTAVDLGLPGQDSIFGAGRVDAQAAFVGLTTLTPVINGCTNNADCEDNNVCTTDSCNLNTHACQNTAIPNCPAPPVPAPILAEPDPDPATPPQCAKDSDCNDEDSCTTNTCDLISKTCQQAPDPDCVSPSIDPISNGQNDNIDSNPQSSGGCNLVLQ